MQYDYLAIEGTIGAGKTSLSSMIAEEFGGRLILEQFEENSFLPKFYKNPDKYAFPLEMSFMASRFQQLKDELAKQELFSSFTISDYFLDKSLIFARQTLKADEYALFSRFFGFINSGLKKPDVIFYLYLEVDALLENIRKRGREYESDIQFDYLQKIQQGYFEYFRQHPDLRVVILDTNDIDFVNRQADYEKVKSLLELEFPIGINRLSL
ncbi:MAG: deoxynucleoside kinase [Bacteroidales bacterium]|nr:deoxynucleoside kinase [Bacteroidales bacterium]MCF8387310.1 deoxynucleoside kinase [Bacteroidales bacterium]MCF8397964.1 deoxynucleoside kinase [Bacteroidales bacterium]